MVETIDADAAGGFKNVAHNTLVASEGLGMGATRTFVETATKAVNEHALAAVGGIIITAGITQWDYNNDRDNIRRQYETELTAQTGKPYNDLTNKDLDKLGQKNAVIGDALKKAKWKRNVGLVAGTLAVGAALVAGAMILGAVGGALGVLSAAGALPSVIGTVTAFATGAPGALSLGGTAAVVGTALSAGIGSVAAFMGTEKLTETIAHAKFGHKEPSIRKVTKSPGLQDQLSLSSQVTYLQHLQKRVQPSKPETYISQEQVFTAILAAQPDKAADIQNQYGNKFSALSADQRKLVLNDANKSINIEQITSDLNHGLIRAQEMAFIMQGESSGVPKHEAPRITALEKAHIGIQNELAEAKAVIAKLKTQMKAGDTKLGAVQGATLDMDQSAPQLITQAIGPAQQRELARRQAASAKTSGVTA